MMPGGEELTHNSVLVWRTVKLAAKPTPTPTPCQNKDQKTSLPLAETKAERLSSGS